MRILIGAGQTNHLETPQHQVDQSPPSIQHSSEPESPPSKAEREHGGRSCSPEEGLHTNIFLAPDGAEQMSSLSEVVSSGSTPGESWKATTPVHPTASQTVTAASNSSPEPHSVHSQADVAPTMAILPTHRTVLSVMLEQPNATTCARGLPATLNDTEVHHSIPATSDCQVQDVNSSSGYIYNKPECNCLLNLFDIEGYSDRSPLTNNSLSTDTKVGFSDICLGHKCYVNDAFVNTEKHDAEESAGLGSVQQPTCPDLLRNETNTRQDVLERMKDEASLMQEIVNVENAPRMDLASVPEYLKVLLEGMDVCGDARHLPDSRPDWLDLDKFRRGQRFALKHLFGLVYAEMISLMMLFTFPDALEPMVFTGKSDTPFKSYERYLSTVSRVISWYRGDVWTPNTEASNNLQTVCKMHRGVRHRLNTADPQKLNQRLTLQGTPVWSTLAEVVRSDVRASQPYMDPAQCPYLRPRRNRVFVNQTDMAITQFGFVGLMILYPDKLGTHGIKDEDLEGFLHFWRGIGYLLGIKDRYNFCSGSLQEARQRSRDFIDYCVKPNMQHVTQDWEHMHRCVVEGISYYLPGTSFESSLLYLCRLLRLETPQLRARLGLWHKFLYFVTIFVMCFLLRLPGALTYHNWLLKLAIKKAQKASPRTLDNMQTRVYSYQKQAAPVSHEGRCEANAHCSFQPIV